MPRLIDADTLADLIETKGKDFGVTVANRCTFRTILSFAPTLDYAPVRHGEWVLVESPYAEYEKGVDGESHDRWTCSLCGGEAADHIQQLESHLAQAERERDAAVADLKNVGCCLCKHAPAPDLYIHNECLDCVGNCNFEWRGVCPENAKEDAL